MESRILLGQEKEPSRKAVRRECQRWHPVNGYDTCVRRKHAYGQLQEGRLSNAICTMDDGYLIGRNGNMDIGQNLSAVKAAGYAVQVDAGFSGIITAIGG